MVGSKISGTSQRPATSLAATRYLSTTLTRACRVAPRGSQNLRRKPATRSRTGVLTPASRLTFSPPACGRGRGKAMGDGRPSIPGQGPLLRSHEVIRRPALRCRCRCQPHSRGNIWDAPEERDRGAGSLGDSTLYVAVEVSHSIWVVGITGPSGTRIGGLFVEPAAGARRPGRFDRRLHRRCPVQRCPVQRGHVRRRTPTA